MSAKGNFQVKENHIERIREVAKEIESLNSKKKEIDSHINALLSSLELLGVSKKAMKKVIANRNKAISIEDIEEEEKEFKYVWELLT